MPVDRVNWAESERACTKQVRLCDVTGRERSRVRWNESSCVSVRFFYVRFKEKICSVFCVFYD